MGITDRFRNAWSAFRGREPTDDYRSYGYVSGIRPDRIRFSRGNERSIVTAVYNRIALDVAAITIQHVQLDENNRYIDTRKSGLNNCLTLSTNIDQTSRSFLQDVVMSMFDEGVVAIVPTHCSDNPNFTDSYDIYEMRTGKIVQWHPKHVRVKLYNEDLGRYEEKTLSKSNVAIVENPFYSVMNEPNSTLKRLIRKLVLLDYIDEQSGSGKLDLIIQLPYIVKSEKKKNEADKRRKELEMQLSGSKYGVAYIDGTEKIVQLNRSVENNLLTQIENLTSMLYSQLGMTSSVFDGTADEKVMLNYYNRTIEPILSAIVDEMKRKFLTPTAITQKQTIMYFRDPFRLVPVADLAELADKFTRNEIMSSNEFRQIIGLKPSDDPKADQLVNSNISAPNEQQQMPQEEEPQYDYEE